MTSARKILANRLNSQRSTGPKSHAGKLRACVNARRHGLAVPIAMDTLLTAKAEALAAVIAGPNPAPEVLASARNLAQAHVDLMRIRQTQQDLTSAGPEKAGSVLCARPRVLTATTRYERRALSRRKFAIRAFDAARQAVPHKGPTDAPG